MKKIRVLITCPSFQEKGGVAQYYALFRRYFKSQRVELDFHFIGSRLDQKHPHLFRPPKDFFSLLRVLSHYQLILVNPSLDVKAIIRDGITNFIARKLYHKNTIVFIHGWTPGVAAWINRFARKLLVQLFDAERLIVLSSEFRRQLIDWGIPEKKIICETTAFVNHPAEGAKDIFSLAYLGRISLAKGCMEAIKTVQILSEEFDNIRLHMIGDGDVELFKDYVDRHNLRKYVKFWGWLDGPHKNRLLSKCGILLFPSHTEGMPLSVIEAMGSGMAIVSRPVGGLADIITEGHNGYLIPTLDPDDFAGKIRYLIKHPAVWKKICAHNKMKAQEEFEISKVVHRFEKIYLACAR